MNASFKFDFVNKSIVASKSALRKASDPATKEYKELMSMMAKQPTFSVVERQIKTSANKTTYKGLNDKAMRDFIGNDAAKLDEYENALKMGGYPLAKHWFLDTYNKPTMTEIRNQVSNSKVQKVRAFAKKQGADSQNKSLALASNQ